MPQRRSTRSSPALALVLWCALSSSAWTQEVDDEVPSHKPGLIAQFHSQQGPSCRRIDELLRFVWKDETPDPRLPPGAFSAQWRGRLFSIEPGEYRLYVYCAGEAELKLNGQTLLKARSQKPQWHAAEPIRLSYG